MVKKRSSMILGNLKYKQKNISNTLINEIEKLRKILQMEENIKYGRKARMVSFVFATNELAKRIRGDLNVFK